jgi:hypothetical protein
MPFESTPNLVVAGITDIQKEILEPTPGLYLQPDNVSAFKLFTEVLTSVTMTDNVHTLSPQTDTPLRLDSLHPITSFVEMDWPPQRVVTLPIVLLSPAAFLPKLNFPPNDASYLPEKDRP